MTLSIRRTNPTFVPLHSSELKLSPQQQLENYIHGGEPIPKETARKICKALISDPNPALSDTIRKIHEALILGNSTIRFQDSSTLYVQREGLQGGSSDEYVILIGSMIANACMIGASVTPLGTAAIAVGAALTIFQFWINSQTQFGGRNPMQFFLELLHSHKLNDLAAAAECTQGRLKSYCHTKDLDDLKMALCYVEKSFSEYKAHFKDEKHRNLDVYCLLAYLKISIHIEHASTVHPHHLEIAKEIAREAIEWLNNAQKQALEHYSKNPKVTRRTNGHITDHRIPREEMLLIDRYFESMGQIHFALRNPSRYQSIGTELATGKSLRTNQKLTCPGGRFELVLQDDGNLVFYDVYYDYTKPVWATNTEGSGANKLVTQQDGNLVLYADSQAVWSTGTHGNPPACLYIREDGDLDLFTAKEKTRLWHSNSTKAKPG